MSVRSVQKKEQRTYVDRILGLAYNNSIISLEDLTRKFHRNNHTVVIKPFTIFKMNNINWSTAALAIVLGFCIVSFNDRLSSLSSLNEKVSDLLQENGELHSIDGMMARSLQNEDIEKKVKRNKRKIGQNKQAVEANADVIGMIVDGSPSIAAGFVCPTGTFMLPHFVTTTSSESCHSGAINSKPGKCIKAFLIANGKEVGCNEKIDDSGTSRTNIVDACCKVTTICPVGTKAKHYGSTSSDAYCLSGPTLDEKGLICTTAFLMP